MRIPWFWRKIWHGSTSGNICLIEVSNPAKFDAFIKKRTILYLNSWTSSAVLGVLSLSPPLFSAVFLLTVVMGYSF